MPAQIIYDGNEWYVTPTNQTTPPSTNSGNFTIGLYDPFPSDQTFNLGDGSDGGVFTPATVTIPAGQTTATFVYRNATPHQCGVVVVPGAGPLSGTANKLVTVYVVASTTPNAFNLTPSSQSVQTNTDATVTVRLWRGTTPTVAGSGGQTFLLSDGSAGGTEAASVTVPAGSGSATFTYRHTSPGTYTLNVVPQGGDLNVVAGQTVTVTVTSPPVPDGFVISPALQHGQSGQALLYTLTLLRGSTPCNAPTGGQAFALSANVGGGTFAPGTTLTVPAGSASATFTYAGVTLGTAIVTATAQGRPYSNNVQTALAVIDAAPLPPLPTGGTRMTSPPFNPLNATWAESYLYGNDASGNVVNFGMMQELDFKDAYGKKELMAPEARSAVAVGISDRVITASAKLCGISLKQWLLCKGGGAITDIAAVANPNAGPALTAGTAGTINVAGSPTQWAAVAFSWLNAYGETQTSPPIAVQLAVGATGSIGVASVQTAGALPTGVTSVNWWVSGVLYGSAAAALAGPLYFSQNNLGAAFAITTLPSGIIVPQAFNALAVAQQIYSAGSQDEPTPFFLRALGNSTGSNIVMRMYGCLSFEISLPLKSNDFVVEDFSFQVYGDPTRPLPRGGWTLFDLIMPK